MFEDKVSIPPRLSGVFVYGVSVAHGLSELLKKVLEEGVFASRGQSAVVDIN